MPRIEETVFISYRRTDVYTALAVYENLKNQGYDVFFDYRSISSGDFEQIISSNIRARAHFLLILTPTTLDRCNEPGDWLRREIEIAIDEKRNIVPLFFKGFRFGAPSVSANLTGKLSNLSRYNGLNVHEDYFDEAMYRLRTQYLSVPLNTVLHPVSTEVRKVVREEQVAADKALEQIEDIKELVKKAEVKRNAPIGESVVNPVETPKEKRAPATAGRVEGKIEKPVRVPPLLTEESKGEGVLRLPERAKLNPRLIGGIAGGLLVITLFIWGGARLLSNVLIHPAEPTRTALSATEAPTEGAATEAPATEAPAAEGAPYTIGISNPFISSEYRKQMLEELIAVNQEYMDKGITTELVIESADTATAGQIQQLQNLMAKNVDAILVNPGDVSGLNATLQEAVDKGIIVISVDQELNVRNVYNVGIDQKEWAKTSAKWLAEKLGGKGNIVEIEGFPGHPANVARMEGVDEVFKDYPDIKVFAKDAGKWDEATGQQVMSNFLSAYPNLDGYWTQDSMAIGALQAVMAANPAKWPQGVGEGRCQYLKLWQEALTMNPDFDSIAVANHPGVSPTGLRIAVNMLQGKEVDTSKLGGANGLSFVIPLAAVITKDNLNEGLAMCEGKPDAYLLDDIMTDEEVVSTYFK